MFQKNKFLNLVFILLMFLYLISLILQFINFDFDSQFGYLDQQLYWQGLSDLSVGKVIYRDFYWEYGLLYLLIGLPFFILFNKTFFASIFIRTIIFPCISIILSFFLGKELLKKSYLFLFTFLLFLYGVNNDFTSLRHILPELGLLTLILGTESNDKKKFILGTTLLGFSLISAIEYGIAAIISALIYFLISRLKKQNLVFLFHSVRSIVVIVGITAVPYFFLWKNQALDKMIVFLSEYTHSFYYNSPCRELFPRIEEIGLGIDFFQRLNLYFVPFLLFSLVAWEVIKMKNSQHFPLIFTLIIYSLLIFYRTLNTPCLNYMNYGLLFVFLILIFILSLPTTSLNLKKILGIILIWLIILPLIKDMPQYITIVKTFVIRDTSKKEFLPIAGVRIKKELVEEYQKTVDLIKNNSEKKDLIYVYPNGPYYQLSERNSAVSIASSWYYDLSPSLVKTTLSQLEGKKPKLVIINTYNATSLKTNLNNLTYNIHSEGKDLIFEGIITPVEDFISSNYEILKKTRVAWVLKKKKASSPIKRFYLPIDKEPSWKVKTQRLNQEPYIFYDGSIVFKVEEENPLINLILEPFKDLDQIMIPIKIDLGFPKVLSKYIINVYGRTKEEQLYLLNRQLASSDWQDIWINLPRSENETQITEILISVSDNKGFLLVGRPKRIFLKSPKSFIRNLNVKIDDSAIKKN